MEKETSDGLETLIEQCLQALHEKDFQSIAGEFVQGFVHNANGPLQNLLMLTEMLLAGLDIQDRLFTAAAGENAQWNEIVGKQRKRLTQMRDQVYGLAGNLREFMQIYEIERNGAEIDINSLLSRMLTVFRSDLFFKHRVKPELRLAKNIPHLRIPGRNIIPALFHLFQNAMTAMRDSPRKELIVETEMADRDLLIRFIDSGCGPCVDDPEQLFGLFVSRWPRGEGTARRPSIGFGLYAARRLLSPYGCSVSLERGPELTSAIVRVPLRQ